MKLTANQFILLYSPDKPQSFQLGLVSNNSNEDEIELSVVTFSRIGEHKNRFEPCGEEVVSKDMIMTTNAKFNMSNEICPMTNEEKCVVECTSSQALLEEEISDELKRVKKIYDRKNKRSRKKLAILGKKSALEISKKIKTGKNQISELIVSAKAKKRKAKVKPPKFRRGKENPLITTLVSHSEQMESKSSRFNVGCCVPCNNKELVRAISTNNRTLFDAILKSTKKISKLQTSQGAKVQDDTFTLSMKCQSPYYFKKIMTLVYGKNADITKKRFYIEEEYSRLQVRDTGSNEKYAYGTKTRTVTVARGNRQGNNALCESNTSWGHNNYFDNNFIKTLTRTRHVHELILSNDDLFRTIKNKFYMLVESGNVDMAGFIAKIFLKNGGYGFSKYHLLALTLDFDPKPELEKMKIQEELLKSKNLLAEQNQRPIVLEDVVDDSSKPIEFNKPFLTKDKQLKLLRKMRRANVTKKAYDNLSITPLHCACINPNSHALMHFLDIGDDLYTYDLELRKPVHYAACSRTPDNLRVLRDRGVDLRDTDKIKKTPLMYACEYNRIKNVKYILENTQCNVNQKCRVARGPIHFAAENGHLVKYLHEKGADLGITGPNRQSVLSLACMRGYYEMAEYILDTGASQIKSDKYGKTPLIHAIQNGHLKLVNLLLMRGGMFDKGDSSKNNPLHYAGAYGFYEMIKLLYRAGADVNKVNSWNMSPITVALMKNHFRCVKEFLDLPLINVNCQDNEGSTLLMNALNLFTPQSLKFSELLIREKSADLSIKNYAGNNIFHKLAILAHMQDLPDSKFDNYINYTKSKKRNQELYESFFKLYLENGIDINEKNVAGDTPLSIAFREKNFLFLDLITVQKNLEVDHLVHEKSELHYFKSVVFAKNAPELLERIISKSKNFSLLMQLFDLNTGYNSFHSVLNEIVIGYYSTLAQIDSEFHDRYMSYLKLSNPDKERKLQEGGPDSENDDIEEESDTESKVNSVEMIEEESDASEDEAKLDAIIARVNSAKAIFVTKPTKKNMVVLVKAKSELYQPKSTSLLLKRREAKMKARLIRVLDIFEGSGYDFNEKVRLYKKPIKEKVLAEQENSYNYESESEDEAKESRIQWRKKKYTVNKEAKSSVFHILMKKANMFLLDYFFGKVNFVKNDCNFMGNSLIHSLVLGFSGTSPKMDVKVYNKNYHRAKEQLFKNYKKSKLTSKRKRKTKRNSYDSYNSDNSDDSDDSEDSDDNEDSDNSSIGSNSCSSDSSSDSADKPLAKTRLEDETISVLEKLLSLGEDPNLHNKQRQYPIIKVCQDGGSDMLHIMVSNNVNLNVFDKKGNSPLLIFAKERDVHSCEYLLANKADITLSDKRGRNALHWSLNMTTPANSNNFDLEEVLIQNGVDLNQKDVRGKPPIFYLFTKIKDEFINSKLDPIEIFSYLLSLKKVRLEMEDDNGNRLIHYCAQRGAYLCMIYLLRAGVKVNVFNHHQNSALNISILNNQNDMSIILLQHNAEVNCPIQIVDYDSLKKYKRKVRQNKEKELQASKKSSQEIVEEHDEETETEEELENEDGLVEEAIIGKFKEDEESESEDNWRNNPKRGKAKGKGKRKRKGKGNKKVAVAQPSDFSDNDYEDEDIQSDDSNQSESQYNNRDYQVPSTKLSSWQLRSKRDNLRESLERRKKRELEWKKLVKLAQNNFITGRQSQFKAALKNSMLSVNFLLIDFSFNLGRAIMDTLSLKKWGYTKTLLNKKIANKQFEYDDKKGRNVFHYLAFFGKSLDKKTLRFFVDRFTLRGIDLTKRDCLQRKPIHYAAMSGNLAFIHLVKSHDSGLQDKDIFGNTLFSLYLQSYKIKEKKLNIFVKEYKNDINVMFKVSSSEFVKQIESFSELTTEAKEVKRQLRKLLNKKDKSVDWFGAEEKFRSGGVVAEEKGITFEEYSTLIFAALKKKDLVLTENLIEAGADLNLKDQKGETILAKIIRNNDIMLLEILKKYADSIDFKAVDNNNRTYLHMVVSPYCSGSFKNTYLLDYLLPLVDKTRKDNNNRTALSYALSHDDDSMSSIILSHANSKKTATKLKREAEHTLVSLPSTVVHSSAPSKFNYDFYKDYEAFVKVSKKEEKIETKNMTYQELAKRGLRPTPDKRVEGELIVIEDPALGRHLNVMLVKVKISHSMYSENLFYKMQLLYEENRKLYILFTNWGRIGWEGQFQQTPFFSKEEAVKEFQKIFKEKTKNEWSAANAFAKKYRKYNLVKIARKTPIDEILAPFDYDDMGMASPQISEVFQLLMKSLLDSKMYQLAYKSFQIDQEHLPLGYLDRETLVKAKHLLNAIRKLLEKKAMKDMKQRIENVEEISAKTSTYYELIPSSKYRETAIPSFDKDGVSSAIQIVNNLLDFEVVSKMLCAAQFRKKVIHPFDYCLRAINIQMAHVDLRSEEAQIILKYITNSTTYKHKNIVENIFAVSRPDEEANFISLDNRRLLWHGTKTENLVSILHSGLRISPPSASHTGSMFGNGVYFADYFDKSLNYCSNHHFDLENRSMYILLCEVSLGKMKRLYKAKEVKKLKGGFNSVKGSGVNAHVKEQNLVLNNGCMVPLGKLRDKNDSKNRSMKRSSKKAVKRSRTGGSLWNKLGKGIIGLPEKSKKKKEYRLNYNEYVIYNTNQVKIRYLIEINKEIVPKSL